MHERRISLDLSRGSCTYLVQQIDSIAYTARLFQWKGEKPPVYIRFYKTDMGWTSAFEEDELIQGLGAALMPVTEPVD